MMSEDNNNKPAPSAIGGHEVDVLGRVHPAYDSLAFIHYATTVPANFAVHLIDHTSARRLCV